MATVQFKLLHPFVCFDFVLDRHKLASFCSKTHNKPPVIVGGHPPNWSANYAIILAAPRLKFVYSFTHRHGEPILSKYGRRSYLISLKATPKGGRNIYVYIVLGGFTIRVPE